MTANISFSVKGDVEAVRKMLGSVRAELLPYATATALTRTAQRCQSAIKGEMARVFDRPTSFTLNSTYIQYATKFKQRATVGIKDQSYKGMPPIVWLSPQVYGGPREVKRSEQLLRSAGVLPQGMYIVPGEGAKLDSHGNMSPGQMQQMLSALGAARDRYQSSTPNSRRRNPAVSEYFVINKPSHLKMGIYRRVGRGTVTPIIMFVRQPLYRQRLRFFEVMDATAKVVWPAEFERAVREMLAKFG